MHCSRYPKNNIKDGPFSLLFEHEMALIFFSHVDYVCREKNDIVNIRNMIFLVEKDDTLDNRKEDEYPHRALVRSSG